MPRPASASRALPGPVLEPVCVPAPRLGKVGVRLSVGDGLLLGVGVGAGLGVWVGVGDGEVVGEVGDGVGLGLGDGDVGLGLGDAVVGLGVGDAVVGLGVGDGLTDAAAATTGKNATVPATRKPTMLTWRMHATRRRLAADDLGCRNLVLEILASKVTVASAPSFGAANIRCRDRLKQTNVNNAL